ncbi:TPA: DUF4400 domain-containing protein [Escherichia coli]|nr:DUF4400 domain-containing protein [Escherichia coli]
MVRCDLRRFGAVQKSGFVYHHAWRMISSIVIASGLFWQVFLFQIATKYVLISAVLVGIAISVTVGIFKKYL